MKETPQILMNEPVCLGLSLLEFSKIVIMKFGMIISNQNTEKKRNYVTWI